MNKITQLTSLSLEAAAEGVPTKPRAKCRVTWKTKAIGKKCDNMKKASLLNKGNSTNANVQKFKKTSIELKHNKKNN